MCQPFSLQGGWGYSAPDWSENVDKGVVARIPEGQRDVEGPQ